MLDLTNKEQKRTSSVFHEARKFMKGPHTFIKMPQKAPTSDTI